jgi:hypothetical protein
MPKLSKTVRALVCLPALVSAALMGSSRLEADSELAAKPEISLLQGIEFRNRGKAPGVRLLVEKSGSYCSAGILSTDGMTRVWILLHSTQPPLVKKLPNVDYRITQQEIKRLSFECPVSNEVAAELRSHLAPRRER